MNKMEIARAAALGAAFWLMVYVILRIIGFGFRIVILMP